MSDYSRTHFSNKKTIVSFALAMMVFFIHFSVFSVFDNMGHSLRTVFHWIYSTTYVAVPLFFIMSGVMFYRNYTLEATLSKWKSRFFSLCIPYLVWNSIWVAIALLGHYTPLGAFTGGLNSAFSVPVVLKGIFMHGFFEPFWFVQRLIILTALCPLIYILMKNKVAGIITLVVTFVLSCLGNYMEFLEPLGSGAIWCYLVGAWLGIHYFDWFAQRRGKAVATIGLLVYALCCVFMGCHSYMPTWLPVAEIDIAVKAVAALSLWSAFDWIEWTRCPRVLGYSFLIYAMHSFVGAALAKILCILLPSTAATLLIVAIATFVLTLIIICVFGYLLEKFMPGVKKILMGR